MCFLIKLTKSSPPSNGHREDKQGWFSLIVNRMTSWIRFVVLHVGRDHAVNCENTLFLLRMFFSTNGLMEGLLC